MSNGKLRIVDKHIGGLRFYRRYLLLLVVDARREMIMMSYRAKLRLEIYAKF